MPYFRPSPFILVALLALLALPADGQAPQAPAPAARPTAVVAPDSAKLASNVLFEAIVRLKARERIAAKIAQQVDMLNQKFRLDGVYYKDTGHRVRLQLDLTGLGDTGSVMLQVCDGKVRWDYQKVLNMQSYRRLEITPIFKRLEDPILDAQFRDTIIGSLGFGGPEAMLLGLQKAIGFDQFADKVVDKVPTYEIIGKWKDRTGLTGPNERPLPATEPLPPYMPSNVVVLINKETLWPYRIELIGVKESILKQEIRKVGPDGRPIGQARAMPKVDPSRIILEYTLLPESEIKPGEHFAFAAPRDETNLIDETDPFLAQLDQYIQMEAARKKAEAAKGAEEPIFKTPIDVPTPGGAGAATSPSGDPAPPR